MNKKKKKKKWSLSNPASAVQKIVLKCPWTPHAYVRQSSLKKKQPHSPKVLLLVSAQSKSARKSHVILPAFVKTLLKLCAKWVNAMPMLNRSTVLTVSAQFAVLHNALVKKDRIIVSALLRKLVVQKVNVRADLKEILSHADALRLKSVWTISLFWWKMNALTNVIRRMSRVKLKILFVIHWIIALVSVVLTDAPTKKMNCWRIAPVLGKRVRRSVWELRF